MGRSLNAKFETSPFVAQRLNCNRHGATIDQLDKVTDQPDRLVSIANLVCDTARMHALWPCQPRTYRREQGPDVVEDFGKIRHREFERFNVSAPAALRVFVFRHCC